MTHRSVATAVVIVVVALSGCASPQSEDLGGADDGCPTAPPTLRTLLDDPITRVLDPTQPWDTLLFFEGDVDPELALVSASGGWNDTVEPVSPANPSSRLMRLRATPLDPVAAGDSVFISWTAAADPSCGALDSDFVEYDLPAPGPAQVAQPGQGVHVLTAGFWENGTLFYTNMDSVDASDWPRAGWYGYEGGDPLQVYVYDAARDERTPVWAPGPNPVTNETAWEYFTTIAGFNEALKGLSSNTTRVVWMTPEDAYTQEGNEAHVLYGDALIFLIRIVSVHDTPCSLDGDVAPCDG